MKQQTIQNEIRISGKGIHTGKPSTVRFVPAETEAGICFVRTDVRHSPPILATWRNVVDTTRATTLGFERIKVRTVEHLLSAVYGAGITNLRIEIDGEEVPILDGSALEFCQQLTEAGIVEQSGEIQTFTVKSDVIVDHPTKASKIRITPSNDFVITYHLNYSDAIKQDLSYTFSSKTYSRDIAPARTFSMISELESMLDQGLLRGIPDAPGFAVIDNESKIEHLQRKTGTDLNPFLSQSNGLSVLSREPLRFSDEMVRHKILDILGDLALSGHYIQGHFEAFGSGHSENVALLRKLFSFQ